LVESLKTSRLAFSNGVVVKLILKNDKLNRFHFKLKAICKKTPFKDHGYTISFPGKELPEL